MKRTLIKEVHKVANTNLYQKYPSLDMSNLEKHPEGHFKLWEVEWIINTYEKIRRIKGK